MFALLNKRANHNKIKAMMDNSFEGALTTRNAVRLANPTAPIGSTYKSTAGKLYIKVANAAADTDWQRVTATAVD